MAQAPANTAALGVGRQLFDRGTFGPDCPDAIVEAMLALQDTLAAMGWLCPVKGDGEKYQNVIAQYDGSAWGLFAGRPDTPLNPDAISITSGGSAVIVELDNSVINASTTVLNFSTNFTVADAGGGQVDIDVTGGGGGGTYNADAPITLTGSDFGLDYGFGLTLSAGSLVADIGDGLEANANKFQVKAHTYIDVTSNGVAVDFTEVASYNGAGDQYLRNNAGTFQWATLPSWAVVAGTYIDVSGQTVNVDLTEVAGYSGSAVQLLGHDNGTFALKTMVEWMALQPGYVLGNKQSYGKDASGTAEWQTDGEC